MDLEELKYEIKRGILGIYYEKNPELINKDALDRKLVCSPILGAYGPQGYAISMEGSTPRGTVFVFTTSREVFFYDNGRNFKNLSNSRFKHVRFIRLIEKYLLEIGENG